MEVIDEETYHFVCEYVSGGYGDVHEDETTYFEFMHALESMKIKTESPAKAAGRKQASKKERIAPEKSV